MGIVRKICPCLWLSNPGTFSSRRYLVYKTFRHKCFWSMCCDYRCFGLAFLAVTAGIDKTHMLNHAHLGRNDFQFFANFLAHHMQSIPAFGTSLICFRQCIFNTLNRKARQSCFAVALFLFTLLPKVLITTPCARHHSFWDKPL